MFPKFGPLDYTLWFPFFCYFFDLPLLPPSPILRVHVIYTPSSISHLLSSSRIRSPPAYPFAARIRTVVVSFLHTIHHVIISFASAKNNSELISVKIMNGIRWIFGWLNNVTYFGIDGEIFFFKSMIIMLLLTT